MGRKKKTKLKDIDKLKIVILILVLIIGFVLMMFVDYTRVSKGKKPIITLKTNNYEDGGSKEFYSIFYKLISYNALEGRNDVEIGTWFKKFDNKVKDKTSADREEISEFIDIRGNIENILLNDSGYFEIEVSGQIYADTLYDLAIVKITDETIIEKNGQTIDAKELKVGDSAEVIFSTLPLGGYPAKANAACIKLQ